MSSGFFAIFYGVISGQDCCFVAVSSVALLEEFWPWWMSLLMGIEARFSKASGEHVG